MTKKGFAFLELVLVLLALSIIAALALRTMRTNLGGNDVGGFESIKSEFRASIERPRSVEIKEANPRELLFVNEGGQGGYRFGGVKPGGSIEKLEGQSWVSIVQNVAFLRFTYYDSEGELMLDQEASKNPQRVKRIKVFAGIHKGVEDSNFYTSDGLNGIDLDGDKSNGLARLKQISFIVDVGK